MLSTRSVTTALILTLALVQAAGCAVPISKELTPDRLRYPGFDTIASGTMTDGEIVEFDMEPASHTARVIGDTLYCFIGGTYRTIPMSEIESLEVWRYVPLPDPAILIGVVTDGEEASREVARVGQEAGQVAAEVGRKALRSGASIGGTLWKALKWIAPVTLPAVFVLAMWQEIR